MAKKIERIRRVREMLGPDVAIEVDGGVNPKTGAQCAEAGATWVGRGAARVHPGSWSAPLEPTSSMTAIRRTMEP